MNVSPNIRPYCSGSLPSGVLFIGNIGNNSGCSRDVSFVDSLQQWINTTRVVDYNNPPTSSGIPPYQRPEQVTAPNCSPYYPPYICGNGINGNPYCNKPDSSSFLSCPSSSASSSIVYSGNYFNCFTTGSASIACGQPVVEIGFKNVYANKAWQGKYAYTSHMNGAFDHFDWCSDNICSYQNIYNTPDTTKYLALSATSEWTQTVNYACNSSNVVCTTDGTTCLCCPNPPFPDNCFDDVCTTIISAGSREWTANANSAVHIDVYGNSYVDICASSSVAPADIPDLSTCPSPGTVPNYGQATDEEVNSAYAFSLLGEANGSNVDLYTTFIGYVSAISFGGNAPVVVTGDGNTWHIEWTGSYTPLDYCGNASPVVSYTSDVLDIDMAAGTLALVEYFAFPNYQFEDTCADQGAQFTVIQTINETWEFSATAYTRTLTAYGPNSLSFFTTTTENVNGSLSTPYTTADVQVDLKNLLATWDMGNFNIYPWRQDSNVTVGPLVNHDETWGSYPQIGSCTSSIQFTGKIAGAPTPIMVDRYWQPDHPNDDICTDSTPCTTHYIKSWGAWSTDIGVPRATQWVEGIDAAQLPQGAFCGANFIYIYPGTCGGAPSLPLDNILWAGKYAETVFVKNSYNFARPCAADRFQVSQSSGRCISSISSTTLTLEPTGIPSGVVSGDYVWVCGTGTLDGCWTAGASSDYSVTLNNPRIISASTLPTVTVANCGTGMLFLLRWQNLQPAVCGRLSISTANNMAPVTCSIEVPTYLTNIDSIYVMGATGLTSINGYWPIRVIDNQTIALLGTNGISQSVYLGGGTISSPFAADWKWDDSSPKGDYTVQTWTENFRDIGEWQRFSASIEYNLGINQCSPLAPNNITSCANPGIPPDPRINQVYCGLAQEVTNNNICFQSCLPTSPCSATVVYFSPNIESFDPSTSRNHGFTFVNVDGGYTSMWQGLVVQYMNDPLWQPPQCPCVYDTDTSAYDCNGCVMQGDDGNCNSDSTSPCIYVYAHQPIFEARCAPPAGAPILPQDVVLGCAITNTLSRGHCNGNICNPPTFGNFNYTDFNPVLALNPPWIFYLAASACVCTAGRFSTDYQADNIQCVEIPI